jgi:hypothetical protein
MGASGNETERPGRPSRAYSSDILNVEWGLAIERSPVLVTLTKHTHLTKTMLLQLTDRESDRPTFIPMAKISAITACSEVDEGHACIWLGGMDYLVVGESAERVAELWATAFDMPSAEARLEAITRRMLTVPVA